MAFNIEVTNPRLHPSIIPHRIAPVRFVRAVSGFADTSAPDIDDHGFILPQDFCTALGPVVGVIQNKTIRVKVIRDRLDPTTLIYPAVDSDAIAALEHPAPGSPIDPNDAGDKKGDCIYLKGTATGSTIQETKVKLHYGAADGPVLAEIAVRVYPTITIRVQAHWVSINGTPSTTSNDDITNIFRRVNRIYAQAGVHFSVAANVMEETVTTFARAGTVTLDNNINDQDNTELQTVLRQNPVADRLNAYFFAHFFEIPDNTQDGVLGVAFSRDDARAHPPIPATGFPGCQAGITFRDNADIPQVSATVAHEIGHALRLSHFNTGNTFSDNIWAQRCLMFNFSSLGATAARNQVGYGNHSNGNIRRGQLLMTKKITKIRQSDQINVLRTSVRNRTYAPI